MHNRTKRVYDKGAVAHYLYQLQRVQTWQLIVVLVLFGFVTLTFLRLNNIGAVQRYQAVLSADQAGDQNAIDNRLADLQLYQASHMNSQVPPGYLENKYKRDVEKIVNEARNYSNPNGNVTAKVDAYCSPQFTVYTQAYTQCFADQLAKYPPAPNPDANVTFPPSQLYRFSYASPLFSFDFAGITVLISLLIALVIVFRIISALVLKALLKARYRSL